MNLRRPVTVGLTIMVVLQTVLTRVLSLSVAATVGRLDAASGSSSATSPSCTVDTDCSLNGVCSITNGTCLCDAPWTGQGCAVLSFNPSPPGGAYGYGKPFAVTSWGGNDIKGASDDTWHMYVTDIAGTGCGLDEWQSQSTVAHAISRTGPLGPYTKQSTARTNPPMPVG